ncbi:MAG: PTS sugar transporter subunit IIC [Erysipelotrichaceae bacterium]|nr:PTS sugar transporter subunit IIC [Erysipelotrichaceae bacterium]
MTVTRIVLILLFQTVKNILGFLGWLNLPAGGVLLNSVSTGLICGNLPVGMLVGGQYELMNVGLNPLGGASVPNYNMGSIIGVYYACTVDVQMGTTMGIIAASLLQIMQRFSALPNLYLKGRIEKAFHEHNWSKAQRLLYLTWVSALPLTTYLPVIILCGMGQGAAEKIMAVIPQWLTNGLQVAGNVLPGMGFAIVLRSLNVEKNIEYLIIGFVLFAYLKVGAVGAALIGVAIALIKYKEAQKFSTATVAAAGGVGDE